MKPPNALTLISKKCVRGGITLKIIWFLSLTSCAAFLFLHEIWSWSVVAFMIAVISSLGMSHVRERYEISASILENQVSIFWVQPKIIIGGIAIKVLGGDASFVLHLSNGKALDVNMPENEIPQFHKWLDQTNPNHFWGEIWVEPHDD